MSDEFLGDEESVWLEAYEQFLQHQARGCHCEHCRQDLVETAGDFATKTLRYYLKEFKNEQ